MRVQAASIPIVDVGGAPPAGTKRKLGGWEIVEVRYHHFRRLSTVVDVEVESPEFCCFGRQWRLILYPGGNASSEDGMVGLYLENSSDESIEVIYRLSTKGISSKEEKVTFAENGCDSGDDHWGDDDFARRSKILRNLDEGTLVLCVWLKQASLCASLPAPFIAENPLTKNILRKFMDQESSDVVFEVGKVRNTSAMDGPARKRGKTCSSTIFHAHRFVLEQCASTLGDLCEQGGGSSPVLIADIDPNVFRHLLHYIYGGKVSDEDMKENAKEIIDAADKFGVAMLKLEAEATYVTSTTISMDNAIDNLLYADAKNCALLKEAVMDFLFENAREGIGRLSFENVPSYLMKDLVTAIAMGKERGDPPADAGAGAFETMRVSALREMLHKKGLDIDGSRESMIARLRENASN